jgi:hypothetical protein
MPAQRLPGIVRLIAGVCVAFRRPVKDSANIVACRFATYPKAATWISYAACLDLNEGR